MAGNYIQKAYNALPTGVRSVIGNIVGNQSGSRNASKNLDNTRIQIPLQRLVQTIQQWRDGLKEAEYYIPWRVKQQQTFDDLIDEPHTSACMERRMDLTLLRDFAIVDANGKELKEWTTWLKDSPWFIDYQRHVLTAKFRGYSLISLGSIVSNDVMTNGLPELKMLPHENVSPDRRNFAPVVYSTTGESWEDEQYRDWHIYVDTAPETGRAATGYGLLHKVAMATLLLRANLSDNANYNEKYGMPVTHGKTSKTETERDEFYRDLKGMGANATFVTDLQDEIEFIAATGSGQGYKTFPDLEARCQKLISKNFVGHADTMDSIAKKSGGDEGNSRTPLTPVQAALNDIASKDGKFCAQYNNELLHKMQKHGVGIPKGARFIYKNDEEEEQVKERENEDRQTYATIAKTMKDAGLQMDAKEFTKRTGIPCKPVEVAPPKPFGGIEPKEPIPAATKNKLLKIYNKI